MQFAEDENETLTPVLVFWMTSTKLSLKTVKTAIPSDLKTAFLSVSVFIFNGMRFKTEKA